MDVGVFQKEHIHLSLEKADPLISSTKLVNTFGFVILVQNKNLCGNKLIRRELGIVYLTNKNILSNLFMTRIIKIDMILGTFDVVTNFIILWICEQNGDLIVPEPFANAIEVWLNDYITLGGTGI